MAAHQRDAGACRGKVREAPRRRRTARGTHRAPPVPPQLRARAREGGGTASSPGLGRVRDGVEGLGAARRGGGTGGSGPVSTDSSCLGKRDEARRQIHRQGPATKNSSSTKDLRTADPRGARGRRATAQKSGPPSSASGKPRRRRPAEKRSVASEARREQTPRRQRAATHEQAPPGGRSAADGA